MAKRITLVAVPVLVLLGLIAYSQLRQSPTRISGFIEADEIRLGSRVGGRVAEVLVEEGQRVQPNQELVRLEPFDLIEQEKEAQAALAARQADFDRLQSGFRVQEIAQAKARVEQFQARLALLKAGPRKEEIEAAQGRLDVANAQVIVAQQNHERTADLFQRNAVSKADMDRAVEELKSAQATIVVRTKELELLKAGSRQEEIEEAHARLNEAQQAAALVEEGYRKEVIEQARAARDSTQAALGAIGERKKELSIRSPIGGQVEALELQAGDMVSAGAPVLSILNDHRLWVRAYVPQGRLDLQVGDRLAVTVDSYPRERFEGEVTFISRQEEFTPSNVQTPEERAKQVFRIKVTLQQGLKKLRPGMTVDVWLDSK